MTPSRTATSRPRAGTALSLHASVTGTASRGARIGVCTPTSFGCLVSDACFVAVHAVGLGSDWDDPPIGQARDVDADPEPDWRWMLTLATVPRPDHRSNPARPCERKLGVDGWWWTGPKPVMMGQLELI